MGWTSYNATHYKNGTVNRKAECDELLTWESEEYGKCEVLKSSMRGSVYYAAVKRNKDGAETVFGVVFLTSVNNKDYYNFSYKDMDETCGPYESDCPTSILNLLSPTDNEYALAWRERCRQNAKNKNNTGKLPVGTVIEYNWYGETKRAEKRAPNYQFKTAWWKIVGDNKYIPKSRIPKDFRVIELGAA